MCCGQGERAYKVKYFWEMINELKIGLHTTELLRMCKTLMCIENLKRGGWPIDPFQCNSTWGQEGQGCKE